MTAAISPSCRHCGDPIQKCGHGWRHSGGGHLCRWQPQQTVAEPAPGPGHAAAYAQEGDGGHLTGRSEPRAPAVACDVVFVATLTHADGTRVALLPHGCVLGISVWCGPHDWAGAVESGVHTLAELAELARQHSGGTAAPEKETTP